MVLGFGLKSGASRSDNLRSNRASTDLCGLPGRVLKLNRCMLIVACQGRDLSRLTSARRWQENSRSLFRAAAAIPADVNVIDFLAAMQDARRVMLTGNIPSQTAGAQDQELPTVYLRLDGRSSRASERMSPGSGIETYLHCSTIQSGASKQPALVATLEREQLLLASPLWKRSGGHKTARRRLRCAITSILRAVKAMVTGSLGAMRQLPRTLPEVLRGKTCAGCGPRLRVLNRLDKDHLIRARLAANRFAEWSQEDGQEARQCFANALRPRVEGRNPIES